MYLFPLKIRKEFILRGQQKHPFCQKKANNIKQHPKIKKVIYQIFTSIYNHYTHRKGFTEE